MAFDLLLSGPGRFWKVPCPGQPASEVVGRAHGRVGQPASPAIRAETQVYQQSMVFYVPEPLLTFVGEGYHPSPERLVLLLLRELGIRVVDE